MGFDPVKEGVIELGGISLSWFLSDSVIVVKSTKRSQTAGLSIIILQRRRASASGGAPTSGEGGQGDRDWVHSRVFIQGVEKSSADEEGRTGCPRGVCAGFRKFCGHGPTRHLPCGPVLAARTS